MSEENNQILSEIIKQFAENSTPKKEFDINLIQAATNVTLEFIFFLISQSSELVRKDNRQTISEKDLINVLKKYHQDDLIDDLIKSNPEFYQYINPKAEENLDIEIITDDI